MFIDTNMLDILNLLMLLFVLIVLLIHTVKLSRKNNEVVGAIHWLDCSIRKALKEEELRRVTRENSLRNFGKHRIRRLMTRIKDILIALIYNLKKG